MPAHLVIQRLVDLPAECAPELHAAANRLLTGLPETDEGALNAVLEALTVRRDPAAGDLVLGALANRNTTQKEDYASMMAELGRSDDTPRALSAVLRAGMTDPDRADLAVTIRALHALRYEQAVPQLLAFVAHPDRAVRGVATEFLYEFADGDSAAPRFESQLAREKDPGVIEMLIDGLVKWDRLPEARVLRQFAEDPAQPPSLRRSASRAMALREQDDQTR